MSEFIYHGKKIKTVGLYGLGKSNVGVIRYLSGRYPELKFILRQDKATPAVDTIQHGFEEVFIGRRALSDLREDILFLSPTVRRDRLPSDIHTLISSDAEFFFENTRSDVFSVTGSDGKSTTATLSALLLSVGGKKIPAIGNIGVAMTPQLDRNDRYTVTELSSFQLMNFTPKSKRALITNISANHLDFHTSYDEYKSAKLNILELAEETVLNFDCDESRTQLAGRSVFGTYSEAICYDELRKRVSAEVYTTLKNGIIRVNDVETFDTGAMKCKNRHTVINLMAAITLTHGYTTDEQILRVGREFSGLRHRCECIGTFAGVKYINSSIDSTPKRTVTTLASFDERLIVILGGKGKGLDYSELVPTIVNKSKTVILTGANAEQIKAALLGDESFRASEIPIIHKECFRDAVLAAVACSRVGDTVILSPASTSFDSFKSFEERGLRFKEIISDYYYKGT